MKVAIIHHWLINMRGGEKVLEALLDAFPNADIYTHVINPEKISDKINKRVAGTTFIQKLPKSKTHYQTYLPLMPYALGWVERSTCLFRCAVKPINIAKNDGFHCVLLRVAKRRRRSTHPTHRALNLTAAMLCLGIHALTAPLCVSVSRAYLACIPKWNLGTRNYQLA